MADAADNNADWVQQWIAQQRALVEGLAHVGAAGEGDPDSKDAARDAQSADFRVRQWSQLGNSYWSGIFKTLQGSGASGADAPAADGLHDAELQDTWRNAWTNSLAQVAASGVWADLLNRAPPLGLFREQTATWRAVAAAQVDCQRLGQEFAAVMLRVQTDALTLLESRVRAQADSGSPVQGFRDLYDLWVECSEQVFSTVAHSSAYGHLLGEMSNAALHLRAGMQKVIEQGLRQFDLPTRSEVNSVHQQLRQLRQRLDEMQRQSTSAGNAASAPPTSPVQAPAKSRKAPAKSGAVSGATSRRHTSHGKTSHNKKAKSAAASRASRSSGPRKPSR